MEISSHDPHPSIDDLEPLQARYVVVPGALWAALLAAALYHSEAPDHPASPALVEAEAVMIAA